MDRETFDKISSAAVTREAVASFDRKILQEEKFIKTLNHDSYILKSEICMAWIEYDADGLGASVRVDTRYDNEECTLFEGTPEEAKKALKVLLDSINKGGYELTSDGYKKVEF